MRRVVLTEQDVLEKHEETQNRESRAEHEHGGQVVDPLAERDKGRDDERPSDDDRDIDLALNGRDTPEGWVSGIVRDAFEKIHLSRLQRVLGPDD